MISVNTFLLVGIIISIIFVFVSVYAIYTSNKDYKKALEESRNAKAGQ